MSDTQLSSLVGEMIAAADSGESLQAFVAKHGAANHGDHAVETEQLRQMLCEVTMRLLTGNTLRVATWERTLTAVTIRSTQADGEVAFDAVAAAIDHLAELIDRGELDSAAHADIVSLGSSLTLLLAAQRKLHQRIEYAVGLLGKHHPASLSEMAERCEDLWHRCGQMSGANSLFVWDARQKEWRLTQDFRPYRPDDAEGR